MTTYILLGGSDRGMTDEQNEKLRDAILENLHAEKPRILSVMFAVLREDWEWKFRDRRTPTFRRLFGKNYEAKLAYPDSFRKDVNWANIVYLHGGDDTLIAHYLDKFEDLKGLFDGKVVIGSSAGAVYPLKEPITRLY